MDQSPNNSVNHRLIRDELSELIYGWCLPRLIHCIHTLRLFRPTLEIFMSKIDIKAACRRCTQRGDMANMSMTTLDFYAVVILREKFGGAFYPYRFTDTISEPATNLGNDLLSCKDWNENEVFSPHVESLEPPLLLITAFLLHLLELQM